MVLLAAALADGAALLDQFTDDRVATPVLGRARADQAAAACWCLVELPDVREVPGLTVRPT